jgi:hypothetical protein
MKKLDSRGISHLLIPIMVVVLLAVAGTFVLVSTHANPANATTAAIKKKATTGTIIIKVASQSKKCMQRAAGSGQAALEKCPPITDKSTHILVAAPKGVCNRTYVGYTTDMGNVRRLTCAPGAYYVATDPHYFATFNYRHHCGKSNCITNYPPAVDATVVAGKTTHVLLGTKAR